MTVKKDERRTKRGGRTGRGKRERAERGTSQEAEQGQPMIMVDPWSMLLERLLGEPPAKADVVDEGDAKSSRPAPGPAVKSKQPRKRRRDNER